MTQAAKPRHSPLMFAALIIGHHFSISARCRIIRATGVCWSSGEISSPKSPNPFSTPVSPKPCESRGPVDAWMRHGLRVGIRCKCGDQFSQAVGRKALLANNAKRLAWVLCGGSEIHPKIEGGWLETAEKGMRGQGADTQGVAI